MAASELADETRNDLSALYESSGNSFNLNMLQLYIKTVYNPFLAPRNL